MASNIEKGINRVQLHNIPKELRSYNQWVAWKAVPNNNGKITKIPVNPNTGGNASPTNPATWGTFKEASERYVWNKDNGIDGIGFVFAKGDPFCGVDLDDCRDPKTGQFEDWAVDILKQLNSYCEISPSDTGVKIFMKGNLQGHGRNFGDVEMYDTGRFFTLTGETFNGYPKTIEDRKAEVTNLYTKLSNEKQPKDPPLIEVPGKPGDVNVDSLPINLGTKKLIKDGEAVGKRSEAIMSVVSSLVASGIAEDKIFSIFDNYKIGEKYREKGSSKVQWLKRHIEKANDFVTVKPDKPEPKEEEEISLMFPYDVMSGAAGFFADLYGSHLETPKEFLYMSYLTCLGSVLSRRLTLATEIAPQPRLYTLLLGQSADERKSTSLTKTIDHFKDAVDNFDVCWGVGSAEGLQKRMEQTNAGLLLSLDEFKQFVSKCKIQSSVLLPCVNTLFESNRYESRTKTTDINLDEAYLSMLAASTVQTYERTWDASFTDIGFNNRLFLVPGTAKRKHSLPEKISDQDQFTLKTKLGEILRIVGGIMELDISPDARELYHNWYMDLERSIHAKRLDTYALRLMSLLAVNDLKNEVDEETVLKVIALCNWQFNVRMIHDPIDADNKIAKMEQSIRRVLRTGPKKERQLKQRVNANRSGLWVFTTARNNLQREMEIILDKKIRKWRLVS
jgi:hypothetical protein